MSTGNLRKKIKATLHNFLFFFSSLERQQLRLLQQQSLQQAYEPFNLPSYPNLSSYSTSSHSPSPVQSTRQPSSALKFYKGGQFTPGGGRVPAGGCYISPSVASSSRSSSSRSFLLGEGTFYKRGQFTPGGGRDPKSGCWK